MSSNFARPERWYDLAAKLMRGDADAAQQIVDYERAADNVFQLFTAQDFQPVIVQNVTTMTYNTSTYLFQGYRVGQLVHLQFRCTITSAGALGAIVVTVPTFLPIALGGVGVGAPVGNGPGPLGTMMVYDDSVATLYHGTTLFNSALGVSGWANAQAGFMGSASPGVALANNDQVGYHLTYITSAVL